MGDLRMLGLFIVGGFFLGTFGTIASQATTCGGCAEGLSLASQANFFVACGASLALAMASCDW